MNLRSLFGLRAEVHRVWLGGRAKEEPFQLLGEEADNLTKNEDERGAENDD